MLAYCLKCRKNTERKNLRVVKTKNERIMILSNSAVCGIKNSWFIREQEASGILNSIGLGAPLSKIPLAGPILFWWY